MRDLTYIDLFCGIGSFHASFKKRGAKCIMACDINENARNTYEANYNMKPLGDICEIAPKDIKKFDILCAGFPCQPFSQAGYHKGFEDERGTLFFQAMKFAKLHRPKIIVFENVPGLLRHDGGKTFKRMISEIEDEGYKTTHKLLKCSDYGIPQMRKRVFVIGIREDIQLRFPLDQFLNFDEYKKEMTMKEYLGKNYEKRHAYTLRVGGRGSKITDRHNWDSYWITENGKKKAHRLEIKEGLKLQGYDENFILKGGIGEIWKQLGNTIPTIFTKMIADKIEKYLINS